MSARISAIAAIGKNREIGRQNELLWNIPADFERLKALTMGHPIIMGRKTFESIGKPLPGRTNMIVSRSGVCVDGALTYDTLNKAVEAAKAIDNEEIFIFGGASIYEAALPITTRLYLTVIDDEASDADVFFPEYSAFTTVVESVAGEHEGLQYRFLTLER